MLKPDIAVFRQGWGVCQTVSPLLCIPSLRILSSTNRVTMRKSPNLLSQSEGFPLDVATVRSFSGLGFRGHAGMLLLRLGSGMISGVKGSEEDWDYFSLLTREFSHLGVSESTPCLDPINPRVPKWHPHVEKPPCRNLPRRVRLIQRAFCSGVWVPRVYILHVRPKYS